MVIPATFPWSLAYTAQEGPGFGDFAKGGLAPTFMFNFTPASWDSEPALGVLSRVEAAALKHHAAEKEAGESPGQFPALAFVSYTRQD